MRRRKEKPVRAAPGMKPRTYALTLILGAAVLFVSVVAANLLINPQGVFGTNVLPRSPNINHHYRNLAAYDAAPDRFDGLLFGSSRALAVPTAQLSRRVNGVNFANFSVIRGMLPDFLPALEYVLADKAKRGQRLQAVFLLLDIDTFGDPAGTNRYIETLLPQALSGESGVYFWWRNLTALQVRSWRRILLDARAAIEERNRQAPSAIEKVKLALVRFASAVSGLAARSSQAGSDYNRPFGERAHFAEQLQLLQRIAALSRQSGAELIVAVSPLHRAVESRYLPEDLSQALDQVARVTPLWDFTGADWLSDNPNYWMGDTAHYSSEVSRMMLARIFGDPMPRGWERFGRLRGRGGQEPD
jgi:hypothetical protein